MTDRTSGVGQSITVRPSTKIEDRVVGAAIQVQPYAARLIAELRAADFHGPASQEIHRAIGTLLANGGAVDKVTVASVMARQNGLDIDKATQRVDHVVFNPDLVLGDANFDSDLVEMKQWKRDLALRAAFKDYYRAGTLDERDAALAQIVALAGAPSDDRMRHYVPGGAFILDAPAQTPAVWGTGDEILWSEGEFLMLVGPQGVGKTAIAGQLAFARLGLLPKVLGWPVTPGEGRVLYIAADRPDQAQRSLRRMVDPEWRSVLDDRLVFWRGPLERDLAHYPDQLVAMARERDADTIVIDSLKDVAMKLADEETGSGVNRAMQLAVAAGVQVVVLHHQRKDQAGAKKPTALADVYGSVFLTTGCGSVVLLWGEPGDPVVELRHLKQPVGEVGPIEILHDRDTGQSTVVDGIDVYTLLRAAPNGLTVTDLAVALYGAKPDDHKAKEKARRKAEEMVKQGRAAKIGGSRGGGSDRDPARYYLVALDRP